MLSLTDLLLLVLGVAALAAPVAHLLIAYLYAPRKVTQWLESPQGMEKALGKALPILTKQLGAWASTPEGEAFFEEFTNMIIEKGKDEATKMLARASGHASQSARAPIMSILGGIKTGNPMMDGLWGMLAPVIGPKLAPMLLRFLPQMAAQQTLDEVPPQA